MISIWSVTSDRLVRAAFAASRGASLLGVFAEAAEEAAEHAAFARQ